MTLSITEAEIARNLPMLALQTVLADPRDMVGDSTIYSVNEAWQHGELLLHPQVSAVRDAQSLEEAMADPQQPIVYVPSDAHLTQQLACRIIGRHPYPKAILWQTHHREQL